MAGVILRLHPRNAAYALFDVLMSHVCASKVYDNQTT